MNDRERTAQSETTESAEIAEKWNGFGMKHRGGAETRRLKNKKAIGRRWQSAIGNRQSIADSRLPIATLPIDCRFPAPDCHTSSPNSAPPRLRGDSPDESATDSHSEPLSNSVPSVVPTPGSSLSRREFVKTSATAATLPLLGANWAFAQGKDQIKVGLIGCGGRGTGAARQALDADPGVIIWSLGDVFPDRTAQALRNLTERNAERINAPEERRFSGFDAYQQVIDSGVDVVLLATPPHFRPMHLAAAIDANKHVFCEKPMAVDANGVRSVIETSKRAASKNRSLASGFCWRYSSPERATFQRIHDGAIGEVVSVHTAYHAGPLNQYPRQPEWSDMEWQLRNWWHFRWLSGDHIVEQACHSIDKINWAMNGRLPLKVSGLGGRLMREGAESGNVFDHFTVIYEYENGARCFHTCRQMPECNFDNTDYIIGTQGNCFINGWGPTQVIKGANPWRYIGETPNMYQVEHNELFASIRSGRPMNDGEWMANSTMMSIIGRKAAYTGQTINWDDALNADEDWSPPHYSFGELPVSPVAKPGMKVDGV